MDIPTLHLITSTTRPAERPRVINPLKLPARYADVIAGIARSRSILLLSGDGALAGTGLPTLDTSISVQQSADSRRVSLRTLIQETTRERPDALSSGRLVAYNQAMTERRIAARTAGRNIFLDFLERLRDEDRLTKCLTTSIDGLESKSLQDFPSKMIPLYGDNRVLRCASPNCKGVSGVDTVALDQGMLSENPTVCNGCAASYKKANQLVRKRQGGESIRFLRPAVQSHISLSFNSVDTYSYEDEDQGDDYIDKPVPASTKGSRHSTPSAAQAASQDQDLRVSGGTKKKTVRRKRRAPIELPGLDLTSLKKYVESSRLFLIVGNQARDPDLLNLTRDLALAVHENDGAVIYIDDAPLHGLQHDHMDIQLLGNVQEVLGEVLLQMRRSHDTDGREAETGCSETEFWFDLIQNDLAMRITEKQPAYAGPNCRYCACGITDYLVACTVCSHHYCHRQAGSQDTDDEGDSDSEPDQPSLLSIASTSRGGSPTLVLESFSPTATLQPDQAAEQPDQFKFDEACIAFNVLSGEEPKPSLAEATASFVCPLCWDHKVQGLYPHYVRPIAREGAELNMPSWPRLALVVFYIEQFWPQTKHLISLIAGRWKQLGWECIIEPVKLQHLEEKVDVFRDLRWEPGSYQIIFVYMTHGLSGEQGYQLNNSQSLRPAELLTRTLAMSERALLGASSSSVFFFSCGHPLHHPGVVAELRDWFDRGANPSILIGCLNKKLSPVYLFTLFSKLTQLLADETAEKAPLIRNTWLRDSVACSHSDLLCLARNCPPAMWLYAPFQSRPLGRPLPSLLSVCPCVPNRNSHVQGLDGKRTRKIWKVVHDGAPGQNLRNINVKAICRACRQAWPLPQETLAGTLIRVNGVYGAIVPYFVPVLNTAD